MQHAHGHVTCPRLARGCGGHPPLARHWPGADEQVTVERAASAAWLPTRVDGLARSTYGGVGGVDGGGGGGGGGVGGGGEGDGSHELAVVHVAVAWFGLGFGFGFGLGSGLGLGFGFRAHHHCCR